MEQQSTLWLDLEQQRGEPGAQQSTTADLQQPAGALAVSCWPPQHGKQLASELLGVQVTPLLGWQQLAKGPKPLGQVPAPVVPQQPRRSLQVPAPLHVPPTHGVPASAKPVPQAPLLQTATMHSGAAGQSEAVVHPVHWPSKQA